MLYFAFGPFVLVRSIRSFALMHMWYTTDVQWAELCSRGGPGTIPTFRRISGVLLEMWAPGRPPHGLERPERQTADPGEPAAEFFGSAGGAPEEEEDFESELDRPEGGDEEAPKV